MMKSWYLISLIMAGLFSFMAAAQIENVGTLGTPATITLPSDNGPVSAKVQEQPFSVRLNSDHVSGRTALLVMVPSRNLYWLGYKALGIGDQRQMFVIGEHIVGVSTYRSDILNFYISSDQLPNADLVESAKQVLQKKFEPASSKNFDLRENSFRMESVLGPFPFQQESAQGEPAPKITNISVTPDGFTLMFRGGKNADIEATIKFGSDFRPVSATLGGKQVFPKPISPSPSPGE